MSQRVNWHVIMGSFIMGALCVSSISLAQVCSEREWRSPLPFGVDLKAVAYGNGIFVAAGVDGNIATSTDSLTWSLSRIVPYGDLRSVIWDGSKFIVGGSGGMAYTSADAIAWTAFDTQLDQHVDYIATNGVVTIVAQYWSATRATTDWSTWTGSYWPGDSIIGLAASPSTFVAIDVAGKVYRTVDGTSWNLVHTVPTTQTRQIIWNGTQFLITTAGSYVATSSNGLVWTDTASQSISEVTWDGTQYVGAYTSQTYVSANGSSWTLSGNTGSVTPWGLAFGGGNYVAIASRGRVLASTNAATWNPRYTGPYEELWDITSNGQRFVVVGENGRVITSDDEINWSAHSVGSSDDLFAVTWTGSEFVAAGEAGAIWASSDGLAWAPRGVGVVGAQLNDVKRGNGMLVAVGNGGVVVRSSNGVSWIPSTSPVTADLNSVAWGDRFVAVGETGTVITSPDGVSWTEQTSDTTRVLNRVVWDGSKYIAGSQGRFFTSSTGESWTDQGFSGLGGMIYGIAVDQGFYLSAGSYDWQHSLDGVDWDKFLMEGPTINSLIPAWHGFIGVGMHGTIVSTTCWPALFVDGFATGATDRWSLVVK